MKNLLFFLVLLSAGNSFCQEVFDEASMTLEAGKIIEQANARIVRSDTVIELRTKEKIQDSITPIIYLKWKTIKYYDTQNRLVMEEDKAVQDSSAASVLPSIFIYDENNNYILECRNDEYGITWLLALLKYDSKGILTSKKYWNEESIGKIVYDNPKKPKKYTFYNSNGKKVGSWRKARRKIPYKRP